MCAMADDADLDRLIAKIHADLRSGRGPGRRRASRRLGRLGSALAALRGGAAMRVIRSERMTRWLVPALIVAVVAITVLLTGNH